MRSFAGKEGGLAKGCWLEILVCGPGSRALRFDPRGGRRPAHPSRTFSMSRPFELQGHRGARGLFPENTVEGFCGVLAVGVTSVELDVAMTADDVLVVTHDPVLNPDLTRGPGGAWLSAAGPAVRSLRLAELEPTTSARRGPAARRRAPIRCSAPSRRRAPDARGGARSARSLGRRRRRRAQDRSAPP